MTSAEAQDRPTLWLLVAEIAAWVGVWIFFAGGVLHRGIWQGKRVFLEINDFGWFFLPLVICAVLCEPEVFRRMWSMRALRFVWQYLQRAGQRAQTLIAVSCLATISAFHLVGTWNRYLSFKSNWDLSIYANACASGGYSSLRDETTLMADHFEPWLRLLTPACQAFDPALVLLTVQVAAFFIGGWGILRLARTAGWSFPSALVCAAFYLLFAGNSTTIYYDFHLLGLALGALPWLFALAEERRWALFGFVALFYLGLKETAPLTLAGIGAFLVLRGRRLQGSVLFVLSVAAFFLIMQVVFPHFRGGAESQYFAKYYGHLGDSMSDVIKTIITRPFYFLGTLLVWGKVKYVVILLAPFLFAHLAAPIFLVPVLAPLAINLLSNDGFMFGGGFHYQAEIHPVLFATFVLLARDPALLKRLSRLHLVRPLRRAWLVWFLLAWSGKGLTWYPSMFRPETMHITLRHELEQFRTRYQGRKVAVIERVATHMSGIRDLYLMNEWSKADVVIIAYPNEDRLWQFSFEELEQKIVPEIERSFQKVYSHPIYPTFRVWERREQSPRLVP